MVTDFTKLELSIEIMMYGVFAINIEKDDAVKVSISQACDGCCVNEKNYTFDSSKYNDFVLSIIKITSELTFDDGLCELYDTDDGLNWNLTINDGMSISSSEKSEILHSIIDIIEDSFSIDGAISSYLNP